MKRKLSRVGRWLVVGTGLLLVMACSLSGVGEQIGAATGPTPSVTAPGGQLPGLATPTPTPAVIPQMGNPTLPPDEPPQAACPQGPAEFGLRANHHFRTPSGVGDWVWEASGYLQVKLDAGGKVTETGPQTIPGSQSGSFSSGKSSCSFEAPAEVIITIDGGCAEGVVSLEIWEDWQMGEYQWTCDDDSFQFSLPPSMMPPSVHQVSYPLGDPAAYTFEIPFGGGSGTKTYTLVPGG
jgi:hypothetical protein